MLYLWQDFTDESVLPLLLSEGLKALLGLGVLLLAGRLLLRRFFEVVADSRSSEAFVALCLLSVTGTSMLTKELGFSDSVSACQYRQGSCLNCLPSGLE